jgi:hypothetical protein
MNKDIFTEMKLWVLTLFLTIVCALQYYSRFVDDAYNVIGKLQLCLLFLFILTAIHFSFNRKNVDLKNKGYVFFIIILLLINLTLYLYTPTDSEMYILFQNVKMLIPFFITLLAAVIIKPYHLQSILSRLYLVAFLFGLIVVIFTSAGKLHPNEILNENTIGFFLAPFLISIFIQQKNYILKIAIFIMGTGLIYVSDAKTTLAAFIFLPLFIFFFNILKNPRMVFTILLSFGMIIVLFISFSDFQIFTKITNYRNVIWYSYFQSIFSGFTTFFLGTGEWIPAHFVQARFEGYRAHNTFINFLHLNGFVGVTFYLCFILFAIRKWYSAFSVSDGMIYLTLVFQLAESNVPLFSFVFPTFIFMISLYLNKESATRDDSE